MFGLRLSSLLLVALNASHSFAGTFNYTGKDFHLNGEKFQIIGGQIDPQRVPWQLWDQRIAMARAMGLNTIFSYIYWDQMEPTQGAWVTDGNNNIAAWAEKIGKAGMQLGLRPGPYICGEHEWGGFPSWLATVPGMAVRTNNGPFLDAAKSYVSKLGATLKNYSITNNGPIIMVQSENEYGAFGDDHNYTLALANMFRRRF